MVNHCKSHNDEYGTIDLLPFMEDMSIKPLLNGHIVSVNNKQFRVERYQWEGKHCYVFVDITMGGAKSKSFAKTPTYVKEAIKENKIKITNTIYPIIK
jgi:DNA repair exonuclease SbcCD nuclease subunit